MRPVWWTQERNDLLRARWTAGVRTADIAAELGCGRNAVIGQAHRLALPPHPNRYGPPKPPKPAKPPKPPKPGTPFVNQRFATVATQPLWGAA